MPARMDGGKRDSQLKAAVGLRVSFAYGAILLASCVAGLAVARDPRTLVVPGLIGLAALIANPVMLKLTGRPRIAGQMLVLELFAGITSMAITNGGMTAQGLESVTLPWLLVLPVLAATLVGRGFACAAAALSAGQAFTMFLLFRAGVVFPAPVGHPAAMSSVWSTVTAIAFLLVVTMINDRALARANAERDALAVELLAAQKLEAVGRLSSGIAHEINTPIQFVSDSVHFVREAMADLQILRGQLVDLVGPDARAEADAALEAADAAYLEREIPAALARSQEGLDRVTGIVRALKAFARADQAAKAPVDLNSAIASTLTVSKGEYKLVAEVETQLDPALPSVVCHAGQINQVVLSLVCNAAQAIADKVKDTGTRGTIAVRTSRDGDEAVIAVRDTGGGIPEAVRGRIFEPYFTTKDVGRGAGQSLSIARTLVLEHQGKLTFETEVGVGTTFFVRLPLAA